MLLYYNILCYCVKYECVIRHIGNGTLCERCKASNTKAFRRHHKLQQQNGVQNDEKKKETKPDIVTESVEEDDNRDIIDNDDGDDNSVDDDNDDDNDNDDDDDDDNNDIRAKVQGNNGISPERRIEALIIKRICDCESLAY